MKRYFTFFFLIVMLKVYGRQVPGEGLPLQKKAFDADLNETTIYFSRDTLYKANHTGIVIKRWYNDSVDLVGHGYRDAAGNPYGVWKYYILSGKKIELYCEGYYTTVKEDNLLVDPGIEEQFPVSSDKAAKAAFINDLADPMLFTGEWRFYKQGRLNRIVVLDNKIVIPYSVGLKIDGGLVLTRSVPEQRMAGTIMATIHFSSTGYPEKIVTKELYMEFDSNGRPVIDPLPDLNLPLE